MSSEWGQAVNFSGSHGNELIEIRLALREDNEGLLALTRATPMAGNIALRIDRDPDFFALLYARGEPVVYVAVCEQEIIGCFSAVIHEAYVRGALERICHAQDLKVHPRFMGRRISLRLIAAIESHLRQEKIDLCFSLVARGNRRVEPVLDGRHGTPREVHLGQFLVDQLLPSPFRPRELRYRIDLAKREDLPAIASMLDIQSRARQFAPRIQAADLEPALEVDRPEGFARMLVAWDGNEIVATLTMEDTSHLRQNVLMGVPKSLSFALAALQIVAAPFPGFNIPRIGRPLTMLYIRHTAFTGGHIAALRSLVCEARVTAFRRRYTFLSAGLHERDPQRAALHGLPGFTFHSLSMATSLLTPDRVKGLIGEVPYEDFALV
jgi:GNAT superfamily N-acetyltransferase